MLAASRVLLLVVAIAAGPAFGHARLLSSTPAPNATLAEAPKSLTLNFSEAAQLGVLKLSKAGKDVPVSFERGAKAAESIAIALPALDPGTYEIEWTALAADDGHVTKGRFSFTVAAAAPPAR
jgi:methionine-rich copper-binding protein CopC